MKLVLWMMSKDRLSDSSYLFSFWGLATLVKFDTVFVMFIWSIFLTILRCFFLFRSFSHPPMSMGLGGLGGGLSLVFTPFPPLNGPRTFFAAFAVIFLLLQRPTSLFEWWMRKLSTKTRLFSLVLLTIAPGCVMSPAGWRKKFSTRKGQFFFFNASTGESQWRCAILSLTWRFFFCEGVGSIICLNQHR